MIEPAAEVATVPEKVLAALERISRGVRAHRQAVATAAGITPLQAELLRTLAAGPPPPALTGQLAAELGVSQPTVSDSLVALERKGHLNRAPLDGDRRRTALSLTEAGAALATELSRADEVVRSGVERLPDTDQEQALRLLLELISGLLDSGVLRVARTCPSCRFYRSDAEGARCALLKVPLPPADLRVNCPEHEPSTDRDR